MNVHAKTENPKKAFGDEKPSIHNIPMGPILEVAKVMAHGSKKYGRKNWRIQPIDASTYYSAMFRHMVDWFENGVDLDHDSKIHHLAHVAASALILLDAMNHHTLHDDRAFAEALHRNPSDQRE